MDKSFCKAISMVNNKNRKFSKKFWISYYNIMSINKISIISIDKKNSNAIRTYQKASPELEKLEKKYKEKTSTEDQQRKAQEMMLIYQKYQINPISGCLLSFCKYH